MDTNSAHFPEAVQTYQYVLWVILSFLIFMGWWTYTQARFSSIFSLTERILAAFVSGISQIVLTTIILGMAHQLFWWQLFIFNFVITMLVRLYAFKNGRSCILTGDIPLFFKTIWCMARSSHAFAILILLAIFVLGWYSYLGQLLPPMTWDSWAYHLPWAAFAHQEGNLGPFDVPEIAVNHFPMNADILFLWSIIGCGTERWANIAQVPFAIAGMLAAYLIARRFGVSRIDSAIAGTFILFVPTVHDQMWTAMVDVAVMGATLTAFAFLARKIIDFPSVIIAGLASGFVVGSKGTGIYLFISLLIFLIFRLITSGGKNPGAAYENRGKFFLPRAAIFIGITLLLGSYWYIRNWITTGNPTGAFDVELLGWKFFSGEKVWQDVIFNPVNAGKLYDAVRSGSEWPIVLDGFSDPQTYMAGGNIGGWGPVWTTLMLPAIPIVFVLACIKRKWALVGLLILLIFPYFMFRYNHTFVRYHLQLLAMGTTSFGILLSMLSKTRIRRFLLGIAVVSTILTVFLAGAKKPATLMPRDILNARRVPYSQDYKGLLFSEMVEPAFLDTLALVEKPATTLALTDSLPDFMNLAAWNPGYTNRVVWVEWNGDGDSFRQALFDKGANSVFIKPDSDSLDWIVNNPEGFDLLYFDPNYGAIIKIVE
jgi:hypothetical protein